MRDLFKMITAICNLAKNVVTAVTLIFVLVWAKNV